jgi:creatinine amidohydrolase
VYLGDAWTAKKMNLADLTWEEVGDYLQEKQSLIIPVGICEQHSKHLPLSTDTVVAEYMANYLSAQTGILVAPTFPYGVGLPCDKVYPGSSSIRAEDLKNTLSSILSWWKSQGFQRFFLISAHGDIFHIKALQEISYDQVFVLELYEINLDGILEKQQGTKHACEAETSVMLYLFPEKVRVDKIEDFETPFAEFKPYLHHLKTERIPNSPGCQGYPTFATKAKGAEIVKRMKENALRWIQQYIEKRRLRINF